METKQTAIEWVLDWMSKNQYFIGNDLLKAVEQAKEMEKSQIIDAYQNGSIDGQIYALTRKVNIENGEEYYNETFNK
jgi:phosphoglycerol transferase MdoB-like AlkP superfamily enzyme